MTSLRGQIPVHGSDRQKFHNPSNHLTITCRLTSCAMQTDIEPGPRRRDQADR
jgi:hypothetical protein